MICNDDSVKEDEPLGAAENQNVKLGDNCKFRRELLVAAGTALIASDARIKIALFGRDLYKTSNYYRIPSNSERQSVPFRS